MAVTDKLPFHLRGNYAPIGDEITATELEVTGEIPPELDGRYLRNGANPITGESEHWFFGDGMIHGVRLSDGRAEWYRNRYVRTPFVDPLASADGETPTPDSANSKANTHVVAHAGRILCLEEGHVPYEIDGELDTVGPHTFGGRLDSSFTAHPKICPRTGEMIGFGYGFGPPYLTYHRVSADGELVQSSEIDLPAPVMMHDFNVTDRRVVFMDLPVVFSMDRAMAGTMPFAFEPDNGARLGVMPRDGDNNSVQWIDVEPCYVFHPVNSYDHPSDPDRVIVDVARYPSMWAASPEFDEVAALWRWDIDLTTGSVAETQLDDRPIEFGRVPDGRVAQDYRYGYAVSSGDDAGLVSGGGSAIVKYDLEAGTSSAHEFGGGRQPGEMVFVPADGVDADDRGAEDHGYLLGYVYDRAADRSDLVILDAADVAAEPLATVHLPRRVPFGFHGSWVPA
ncbi:MAG: carotenoid oxygenase family protein [Actinomycetota bacterium]